MIGKPLLSLIDGSDEATVIEVMAEPASPDESSTALDEPVAGEASQPESPGEADGDRADKNDDSSITSSDPDTLHQSPVDLVEETRGEPFGIETPAEAIDAQLEPATTASEPAAADEEPPDDSELPQELDEPRDAEATVAAALTREWPRAVPGASFGGERAQEHDEERKLDELIESAFPVDLPVETSTGGGTEISITFTDPTSDSETPVEPSGLDDEDDDALAPEPSEPARAERHEERQIDPRDEPLALASAATADVSLLDQAEEPTEEASQDPASTVEMPPVAPSSSSDAATPATPTDEGAPGDLRDEVSVADSDPYETSEHAQWTLSPPVNTLARPDTGPDETELDGGTAPSGSTSSTSPTSNDADPDALPLDDVERDESSADDPDPDSPTSLECGRLRRGVAPRARHHQQPGHTRRD